MKRSYDYRTLQEAQEAAIDILHKENESSGLRPDFYQTTAIRSTRVADSFTAKPVTPFDVPREYTDEAEDEELYIQGYSDNTGEEIGGRAYIYPLTHTYPEPHRDYIVVALSPEELDPSNFTLPFRNLNVGTLHAFARVGLLYSKPTKEVTPEQVKTPEGELTISSYLHGDNDTFWEYDRTKVERLSKEDFFSIADEEVESDPEEYSDFWDTNLIFSPVVAPSLLSELTGRKVTTAQDYASALESLTGSTLNKRERRQVIAAFNFISRDLFFDYALYEFIRTEDYSHLKEILSLSPDFGLPDKWERDYSPLWKWEKGTRKKVVTSAEEAIVGKYLQTEFSTMLSPVSLREISEGTGIPLSLIYKASNRSKWD